MNNSRKIWPNSFPSGADHCFAPVSAPKHIDRRNRLNDQIDDITTEVERDSVAVKTADRFGPQMAWPRLARFVRSLRPDIRQHDNG